MSDETSNQQSPTPNAVFGGMQSLQPSSVGSPIFAGATGEAEAPVPVAAAPPSGGGRLVWLLAIAGALTLLIGGGVLASQAFSAQGGGETPEEVVDGLIAALDNEDLIGIGELLDPAERRTLVDPVLDDIVPELIRLGLLSDTFDASGIAGLDFELTDVTYVVEPVSGHPDLMNVFVTGGSATTTVVGADLPYGDAVTVRFREEIDSSSSSTSIDDIGDPSSSAFTLIERDGRWYLSTWFSIVEKFRGSTPMPSFDEQPISLGSASPEAAVEALIADMVDLDIDGMIGRLDPDEMAVLYRYSPLFLDEARAELAKIREEANEAGDEWDVTGLEFDVDADGNDAIVSIRSFTATLAVDDITAAVSYSPQRISVTASGSIDEPFDFRLDLTPRTASSEFSYGEGFSGEVDITFGENNTFTAEGRFGTEEFSGEFTADPNGTCSEYSYEMGSTTEQGCLEEELGALVSAAGLVDVFEDLGDEFPGFDVATYRSDGAWYVSPVGTVMHYITAGLRDLDREAVDAYLEPTIGLGASSLLLTPYWFAGYALGELGSTTTETFVPIGEDLSVPTTTIVPEFTPTESVFEIAASPVATPYVGALGAFGRDVWLVEVAEGQTVGVTLYGIDQVDAGINDPFLEIQTPDGQWSGQNDDNDGFNSGLQFTADSSGLWRIVVSNLGGAEGAYELTVEVVDAGSTPTIGEGQSVPFIDTSVDVEDVIGLDISAGSGSVHDGSLSAGGYDVFQVDLSTGDTLLISLEAGDGAFDPKLLVNDPAGNLFTDNDDAPSEAGLGNVFDSQLELIATESGRYNIEVRSFGDIGSGSYTLTIANS